jgi:hypothetical protein
MLENYAVKKNYHVMFLTGPNDKRSTWYNDGFTDYEAAIEQVVEHLSIAFPEKMVASEVPKAGALIVVLACVEACGTVRLLSMCVSIWNEHEKENKVPPGLTSPSLPLTSNSNKKFVLPGTQATEFCRKGMFLAVLHSLQVCIAFRSDYDSRPLDRMWTMAVSCPRQILVPYFADHGFSPDKGRLTDEKTNWMKIESPMRVSARESGEMMSPGNTRNERFCCKRIALQQLGDLAWKYDPDYTTMSFLLV